MNEQNNPKKRITEIVNGLKRVNNMSEVLSHFFYQDPNISSREKETMHEKLIPRLTPSGWVEYIFLFLRISKKSPLPYSPKVLSKQVKDYLFWYQNIAGSKGEGSDFINGYDTTFILRHFWKVRDEYQETVDSLAEYAKNELSAFSGKTWQDYEMLREFCLHYDIDHEEWLHHFEEKLLSPPVNKEENYLKLKKRVEEITGRKF